MPFQIIKIMKYKQSREPTGTFQQAVVWWDGQPQSLWRRCGGWIEWEVGRRQGDQTLLILVKG